MKVGDLIKLRYPSDKEHDSFIAVAIPLPGYSEGLALAWNDGELEDLENYGKLWKQDLVVISENR